MRTRTWWCTLAATCALGTWLSAAAHPLGNFTINRYSRLELSPGQINIYYVLDMAEIPTFQETGRVIDQDGDGQVSEPERTGYLASLAEQLRRNLHLTIDRRVVDLVLISADLTFPEGQSGLNTLRFSGQFTAPVAGQGPHQAEFTDDNYSYRLGWKEIVVRPGEGVGLLHSTAPTQDTSDALRRYPTDLLSSPLDQRSAQFSFQPGATSLAAAPGKVVSFPRQVLARSSDAFSTLINAPQLGLGMILLSLLLACFWGALHALSPGHGKAVVAAYLVGARGTARHALFLGLTVTITHTAGVLALGLVTLFASQFILPEQLYPWLGLFSGLLVVGIGWTLFTRRLRAAWQGKQLGHDHHHEHADHHQGHTHSHHHHGHSHLPPAADRSPVGWRSLLALGISGGLLPCPSALVVMLSAIALHRVGFGLALILAFSTGLAGVLTAIGLLFVYAGRLVERRQLNHRLLRILPVAGALVVMMAGLAITMQALGQVGLKL